MRARPLLAVLLTPLLLAAADSSERLEKIRAEIEEREARAAELASEAKGVLGELEALDRLLAEARTSIRRLRRRRQAAEEELKVARSALEEAERDRARIEKALRIRLVALYKFRSTGGLPALASAADFQAQSRLSRGLERVLEQDAGLFLRYQASERLYRERRDTSQALVRELELARREIAGREQANRRRGVERRNLVSLLRTRADREQRAAAELREAARRLEETIRNLPADRGPGGPGLARGAVPAPVPGRIRSGFGRQVDATYQTVTVRTGVEIAAPAGSQVRAVAPGQVLFAGWFRGYGQMVILDHGQGTLTVSGYLRELEVEAEDRVQAGQTIGTVGQTGTASAPGLYFEIRRDGKAVDPGQWLE